MVKLGDTAEVTFFNKETGEKVFETFTAPTNTIRVTLDKEWKPEYCATLVHRTGTIDVKGFFVDGVMKAKLVNPHPVVMVEVNRLAVIKNKTKKKRIKNKLNNRILDLLVKNL